MFHPLHFCATLWKHYYRSKPVQFVSSLFAAAGIQQGLLRGSVTV
jgi:hypothetical protein